MYRTDRPLLDFSPAEFKPLSPLALPLTLCAAYFLTCNSCVLSILGWLAGMVFHEVGHAVVFWLSGRPAIPSFGVTLPLVDERSWIFFFGFGAALIAGGEALRRGGNLLWAWCAWGMVPLLILFTLVLPWRIAEQVMLYGGLGGELYLAAFTLIICHLPAPRVLHWERNRYLFLILGAISLVRSVMLWISSLADPALLPMGAVFDFGPLFGDGSESGGDLDRLIRDFGWTPGGIVWTYRSTAIGVSVALGAFYLRHLLWPWGFEPQVPAP